MNPASPPILSPREVARILIVHAGRWLIPTVVLGALAVGYALMRPATWEASQALIIRNAATNNEIGPGKFGHVDEMKTVQETILEVVKSRSVLAAALQQVGPPADGQTDRAAWPTPLDVAALRGNVALTPPKGAEFGKTEVFYLETKDHDRPRATALNRAICDQLLARFQHLRDAKAQSMIHELLKTVHLAKLDLDRSTTRLTAIETEVGSDLAELRALDDAGAGESVIQRTISEIRNELRQIVAAGKAHRQLLSLLEEAREDPGRLMAMPNGLLESQPALRRLKDGLVDAQLKTAALQGMMSDEHPLVQAAQGSEEQIGRHLHNELEIAIRGIQVDLQMNGEREQMLRDQLAESTGRLDRLARLRATYANQVAETRNRAALVQQAEGELADARATHAGAKATSLISRIDAPNAGMYPVGPGRGMIAMIGLAGGLLTGFGVLFLTVPSAQPAFPATRPTEYPALPIRTARKVIEPALKPGDGLSFKQALQKIVYGNPA